MPYYTRSEFCRFCWSVTSLDPAALKQNRLLWSRHVPLIEKGYQFRFNKDFSTEALSTIWKCHYRTACLLLKPGWLKLIFGWWKNGEHVLLRSPLFSVCYDSEFKLKEVLSVRGISYLYFEWYTWWSETCYSVNEARQSMTSILHLVVVQSIFDAGL